MIFVSKIGIYQPLLARSCYHNLTKLVILSPYSNKSVEIDCILIKTSKYKLNGLNNKMAFNLSAAHNPSNTGGSSVSNIAVCGVPDVSGDEPGPSNRKCIKKESTNIINISQSKIIQHSYVQSNNNLIQVPILPNSRSLQNVSLRRQGKNAIREKRHASADDIHQQKAQKDTNTTANLRWWIPTAFGRNQRINSNEGGQVFTLLSYNVLSQDLLAEHAYLYKHHSTKALMWETRWKNLYNEISAYNADILCLQEVQENHIENYYNKIANLGYDYLFKKRTGYRTDGCLIFYRRDLFNLVDHILVEFYQPGTTVLDRENVAIVAVFSPVKAPEVKFVVATTHLLYNPRRQDIRLAQTQVLLAEVERMAFKGMNKEKNIPLYHPVIITGDFNSEPDSAVLELLLTGKLKYNTLAKKTLTRFNMTEEEINKSHLKKEITGNKLLPSWLRITDQCQHLGLIENRDGDLIPREKQEELINIANSQRDKELIKQEPENSTLFSTGNLSHKFNLKSPFPYRVKNDTVATTYQDAWIMVDYIFFSNNHPGKPEKERLKLIETYSVPTTKQLRRVKNIPNFVLGSDHLSLLAKFKLEFKK